MPHSVSCLSNPLYSTSALLMILLCDKIMKFVEISLLLIFPSLFLLLEGSCLFHYNLNMDFRYLLNNFILYTCKCTMEIVTVLILNTIQFKEGGINLS